MPVEVLQTKEGFEKAINGPHAVVLDLSNNNSPCKFIEKIFDEVTASVGVPGYRMDPKVAGIPANLNAGTLQVYHQGKMIRQEQVTSLAHQGDLESLIKIARKKRFLRSVEGLAVEDVG